MKRSWDMKILLDKLPPLSDSFNQIQKRACLTASNPSGSFKTSSTTTEPTRSNPLKRFNRDWDDDFEEDVVERVDIVEKDVVDDEVERDTDEKDTDEIDNEKKQRNEKLYTQTEVDAMVQALQKQYDDTLQMLHNQYQAQHKKALLEMHAFYVGYYDEHLCIAKNKLLNR